MKIIVNKDALIKALNWVQNVVEKRSSMPILSHALFKASKSGLHAIATNLQMVIEGRVDAEVSEEGSICLNAKRLQDIVRALPSGDVSLTCDANNKVEIKGEKGVFHLMGISASEYPPLPDYEDIKCVDIDSAVLKSMIGKTIFAASLEESRYNLEGILMQAPEGQSLLRMVATDGHRLCMIDKEIANSGNLNLSAGVILPRRGLNELKRVLSEESAVDKAGFGTAANDAIFKVGPVVFVMRTLEGDYPNYDRVVPKGNDKKVVVRKDLLIDSLSRVSIISDEKTRGVKLTIDKGKILIESQNPEIGDATDEIEVDSGIKGLKVGFNAVYLLDALRAMDGDEVELNLKDEVSSGLFLPKSEPGYTCVVMPMRL